MYDHNPPIDVPALPRLKQISKIGSQGISVANVIDDLRFAKNMVLIQFNMLKLMFRPTDTFLIFNMIELADRHRDRFVDLAAPILNRAHSDPEYDAMFENDERPPLPDLEELKHLPETTLGGAFAKHMIDLELDVEFFGKLEVPKGDRFSYLDYRARVCHDVWHILTGFDTTVAGEVGLQAFTYAQIGSPLAGLITGGGLMNMAMFEPAKMPVGLAWAAQGFEAGSKCRMLLGFRHEEFWDKPLTEVRELVGLPAQGLVYQAAQAA